MIGQFNALLAAESVIPAPASNKTYRSAAIKDYGQFKDIISNKISRTANERSAVDPDKGNIDTKAEDCVRQEAKQQIRSYRDLPGTNEARSNSKTGQQQPVCNEAEISADGKDLEKKSSDIILFAEGIAQIMNMSLQDVILLLENARVEPSDMADGAQTAEIVSKLSDLMQLNGEQTKALAEVLDAVRSLTVGDTGSIKPGLMDGQGGSDSKSAAIDHANIIIIDQKKPFDLSGIISEFKARLDRIKIKHETFAEGSDGMNAISLDGKDGYAEVEGIIAGEAKQEVAAGDSGQDDNQNRDLEGGKQFGNGFGEAAAKVNQQEANNFEYVNKALLNNLPSGPSEKSGLAPYSTKIMEDAIIPKNELLNQIVEKAKFVLTGDKSEMVMDLKPDHFGKLSLKLVTENGMVMANFVADNQQVKEVLEANMQLLKNALEKQGFMVQGFNVSVGQDLRKEFEKRSFAGERLGTPGIRKAAVAGLTGNILSMADVPENLNPYLAGGSNIDLIA